MLPVNDAPAAFFQNCRKGVRIMKTIAIIESCDTKFREAALMKEIITAAGLEGLVINVATGPDRSYHYDIPREEVAAFGGTSWKDMEDKTKGEKIAYMQKAVSGYVKDLYEKGRIHGVVSVGGLQNTVMATEVMKHLPIGVPKVMATTVAGGQKTFGPVVGERDIVVIPSICDFTGINMVTEQIIRNACACCIGMLQQDKAGEAVRKGKRPVVGVTLMGITNKGGCAAIDELERCGVEAIGFHSTGTGGGIMEEMASNGLIDGILDMTVHEISEGWFGSGFSFGPCWETRITKSLEAGVPLVVCPGGLDFCDFSTNEFPPRMDERRYMMHNGNIAHIKLLPEEAGKIAAVFAGRLEKASYPVRVLVPTMGMRHNTMEGEDLYDPEVDEIIIRTIDGIQNENVRIEKIPGNLDTRQWGIEAAHRMLDALRERGIIE